MTSLPADPSCGLPAGGTAKPCALLWDESLLWGIMAWRALRENGLPFDLLRAEELRRGALDRYALLLVPGGWASNKLAALGEGGCEAIRRFVTAGGSYLGICGGAGLATREGMALLPVGRVPSERRVTSFSGPIRVLPAPHPVWQGLADPIFQAWWPSQLRPETPDIAVLAAYAAAQPGAFSSDISVEGNGQDWTLLEARYGILLDPARLQGEPAVLEGRCGQGRVVLSMLHFDTPGNRNGGLILRNLWRYLAGAPPDRSGRKGTGAPERAGWPLSPETRASWAAVRTSVAELLRFAAGLGLWQRRNPYLLQWRRGVRGLEYSTLDLYVREIEELLPRPTGSGGAGGADLRGAMAAIDGRLSPFVAKARELLALEARLLARGPLSPLHCDDGAVQALREALFGGAMRHGGAFKELMDALDGLWLGLVRR